MKRKHAALAAMLAAAIPLQKEIEAKECKEHPCANDTFAKVPDQPHSHEEPPNYEWAKELVGIGTSPMTFIRKGTQEHLNLLASKSPLLISIDEQGNYEYIFPSVV